MLLVKLGAHVINFDQVSWIEVTEGRPTVHSIAGGVFRPRTEEEAASLHAFVNQNVAPPGAQLAAFGAWTAKK